MFYFDLIETFDIETQKILKITQIGVKIARGGPGRMESHGIPRFREAEQGGPVLQTTGPPCSAGTGWSCFAKKQGRLVCGGGPTRGRAASFRGLQAVAARPPVCGDFWGVPGGTPSRQGETTVTVARTQK